MSNAPVEPPGRLVTIEDRSSAFSVNRDLQHARRARVGARALVLDTIIKKRESTSSPMIFEHLAIRVFLAGP